MPSVPYVQALCWGWDDDQGHRWAEDLQQGAHSSPRARASGGRKEPFAGANNTCTLWSCTFGIYENISIILCSGWYYKSNYTYSILFDRKFGSTYHTSVSTCRGFVIVGIRSESDITEDEISHRKARFLAEYYRITALVCYFITGDLSCMLQLQRYQFNHTLLDSTQFDACTYWIYYICQNNLAIFTRSTTLSRYTCDDLNSLWPWVYRVPLLLVLEVSCSAITYLEKCYICTLIQALSSLRRQIYVLGQESILLFRHKCAIKCMAILRLPFDCMGWCADDTVLCNMRIHFRWLNWPISFAVPWYSTQQL